MLRFRACLSFRGHPIPLPSSYACRRAPCGTSVYLLGGTRSYTYSRSALVPSGSGTGVKFVMYKSGAAHPIFGDEAREIALGKGMRDSMDNPPDRAVVALRHPRLIGANLDEVRHVYAPKLRVGGPAVVVDDREELFANVQILDDLGGMMSVTPSETHFYAGSAMSTVPATQVFAGWPARDAELTYPVHMLAEDVEFMWPEAVRERVMVKRAGLPVAPDTCLGTLLRSPKDLHISINCIDYPLELDLLASKASNRASKDAKRRRLYQVLLDEARFLLKIWPVLLFWVVIEYKMYKSRHCIVAELPSGKLPRELLVAKQPQEEVEPFQDDSLSFTNDFYDKGWTWGEAQSPSAARAASEKKSQQSEENTFGDMPLWHPTMEEVGEATH